MLGFMGAGGKPISTTRLLYLHAEIALFARGNCFIWTRKIKKERTRYEIFRPCLKLCEEAMRDIRLRHLHDVVLICRLQVVTDATIASSSLDRPQFHSLLDLRAR